MKVLIADLFSGAAIEEMKSAGVEVVYNHQLAGDSLKEALASEVPQVLVVRSTKVTADIIQACPPLEVIIRAGAGVDNIDISEASNRGIYVANCPGKNSVAVAELVMGHILCVDRRIAEGVNLIKQGKWAKGKFTESLGIKGRKLGIIGLGAIGREVAKRALSFDMEVCGTDPFVTPEQAAALNIQYFATPEEVARESDILTFHVPSTPSTKGMINSKFVSLCKENVVILNTARGDLTNEEELLQCLEQRPNMWYACDVLQGEPAGKEADFVSALGQHPRVYATHHIGASTKQSENAIGQEALRIILKYNSTRTVDLGNLVNLQKQTQAQFSVIMRHFGREGAFAALLSQLKDSNCKVLEVENKVFRDSASFSASVNVQCGDKAALESIAAGFNGNPDVIHCAVVNL